MTKNNDNQNNENSGKKRAPRQNYHSSSDSNSNKGGDSQPRRSYSQGQGDYKKKSYGNNSDNNNRYRSKDGGSSYGDKKPYSQGGSSYGDRKQYGDKKPYSQGQGGYQKKSYGNNSEGGGERRFRKDGDKGSSYGNSSYGNKKPYSNDGKPRRPRVGGNDKPRPPRNPISDKIKAAYALGNDGKFDRGDRRGGRDRNRFDSKEKTFRTDKNQSYSVQEKSPDYSIRPDESKTIRLNRYISNSGICSRREADKLIEQGLISVNGKTITEMGHKVNPGDVVKYENRVIRPEKFVYVLLNKPKDFITTTEDPDERRTVMHLVSNACKERIYPVGRLDRNTTGLLLFTNDGDMAKKLTHPSHNISKIYQVELDKPLAKADFESILAGIQLEDGAFKADDLAYVGIEKSTIGIEIHEGRNRLVRRVFEHFGYTVTRLDRVVYAGLTKKDLPRGHWRYLTEKEVLRLR